MVFNLISGEVINTRLEGLKPYDQQKMTRCFLLFFTCSMFNYRNGMMHNERQIDMGLAGAASQCFTLVLIWI